MSDAINPKISNPNNISSRKSSLDKSILQVFQSLSKMKGNELSLKKKDNMSNPSTFILKNLTLPGNSVCSESQQESLQNNTFLEMNKILTLGRPMEMLENLNHRGQKLGKGCSINKENSQSVIKSAFHDDMSIIGKVSLNQRNDSGTSKHKELCAKLSGGSENISKILRNLEQQYPKMSKHSSQTDHKVKITSEELKQKLDHLKDISESFVDIKNIPKYRQKLIDLHRHLNQSSSQQSKERDAIKLDTGSRLFNLKDGNSKLMSQMLSTQTGNQIRDKPPYASCKNESPERQILPMNLIEQTEYQNMHRAREASEYECISPTSKNLKQEFDNETWQSIVNPLVNFQSETTVKESKQAAARNKDMTEKKAIPESRELQRENFSSNKKRVKHRRNSNNKSTSKKGTSRKSFSTQKKTVRGCQTSSRSPGTRKRKKHAQVKMDVKRSLWKNEKKPQARNVRRLVSLMKNNDYSKMNIQNLKKAFMNRGVFNYTTTQLKRFN